MLFYLPLAGSAFKKVYFDTAQSKAMSKFIEPQDLIVPYEVKMFSDNLVPLLESLETRKLQSSMSPRYDMKQTDRDRGPQTFQLNIFYRAVKMDFENRDI